METEHIQLHTLFHKLKRTGDIMFKIENKKELSTNKCIRFPNDLLEQIKKQAKNNNITFSKFVILACEYALQNIDHK